MKPNQQNVVRGLSATVVTVLLWSSLAAVFKKLEGLPPFFILAVALTVGLLPFAHKYKNWCLSWKRLLFGGMSIFLYHLCLFIALNISNPIEVNMINYLWPVLIVLLTPILRVDYKLKLKSFTGVLVAFAGIAILFSQGVTQFSINQVIGYLLAFGGALIWAFYSVWSRRWSDLKTIEVAGFCAVAAVFSILYHLGFESTPNPSTVQWTYLFFLGIGPMGFAFYSWNIALRDLDPNLVAALSYFTPLLSTLFLAAVLQQSLSPYNLLSLVLVILGSILTRLSEEEK